MMFKKELVEKILSGEKTATRRMKQQSRVGGITNLMVNKDYSKETGTYIQMTAVYQQRLGDMTDLDAQKEGFRDLSSFKEYWTRELRDEWNPDNVVWVHEFRLLKKRA